MPFTKQNFIATTVVTAVPFVVDYFHDSINNCTSIPYIPQYLAKYSGSWTEILVSSLFTTLFKEGADVIFDYNLNKVKNPVEKLVFRDAGKIPGEFTLKAFNVSLGSSGYKHGPGHIGAHTFKPFCKVAVHKFVKHYGYDDSIGGRWANLCEGLSQMPIAAQQDMEDKRMHLSYTEFALYAAANIYDSARWALQGVGTLASKIAPAWFLGEGLKQLHVWSVIEWAVYKPVTFIQTKVLSTIGLGLVKLDPYIGTRGKWKAISTTKKPGILKFIGYTCILFSNPAATFTYEVIASKIFLTGVRPFIQGGNDLFKWAALTGQEIVATSKKVSAIEKEMKLLQTDVKALKNQVTNIEGMVKEVKESLLPSQEIAKTLTKVLDMVDRLEHKLDHQADFAHKILPEEVIALPAAHSYPPVGAMENVVLPTQPHDQGNMQQEQVPKTGETQPVAHRDEL